MATRAVGEMAQFYGDKPNNDGYDNGVWSSLLDIPYIQKIEEASLYKVIIRTMWLDATGWSKEIRNRWPHIIQIGLNDHPLSAHISKLSADRQAHYIEDLEYLDGIMAISEEERQWYQITCPSKPVVNVGLPFPAAAYEERYGKFRNNEKQYIGLGVGASDNDRNFVSNLMVFQRLRLENPNLKGLFLSIPTQLIPYCSYWADKIDGVFIHQRKDTEEYMEVLSQCSLVLNLADRNTPGRLQGEAAFFEIPCVGSNRLELQNILFNTLSVSPYSLEDAFKWSQKLLDDPDWGKVIGANARAKLIENFDYEPSRKKFEGLLAQIRGEEIVRLD
jgi:hypothetical protein